MRQPDPLHALLVTLAAAACWQCSIAVAADHDPVQPVPEDSRTRAALLLADGIDGAGLVTTWNVLHAAGRNTGGGVRAFTVAAADRAVTTAEGLRLRPDATFDSHPEIDVLVIPSIPADLELDPTLVEWVRKTAARARLVLAHCRGTFLLAEAGVLENRAATTCPGAYRELAARHADLDLRINTWFVQDGPVITSQGGSRSYQAALYLVETLMGREVTESVAEELLVPWPPNNRSRPAFVTGGN